MSPREGRQQGHHEQCILPAPAPPGLTSLSIMLAIRTAPPKRGKLLWLELAAPSAVAVAVQRYLSIP
jgi:hypothetical protein